MNVHKCKPIENVDDEQQQRQQKKKKKYRMHSFHCCCAVFVVRSTVDEILVKHLMI